MAHGVSYTAFAYLRHLFGEKRVVHAGNVCTYVSTEKHIRLYEFQEGISFANEETKRLNEYLTGIRLYENDHPCGVFVLPEGAEPCDFTPVRYEADMPFKYVTHMGFSALRDTLVEIDVLHPAMVDLLWHAEHLSGVPAAEVPLNDPKVYALLQGTEPLGIKPWAIGGFTLGTLGLPELSTAFMENMIQTARPRTFADLVKINGLAHGSGTWLDNAENLIMIKNEGCTLFDVAATREDVMTYLLHKAVDRETAYAIMEMVRMGNVEKRLTKEQEKRLRLQRVPEWYIDSLKNVLYMFPKAHAVDTVIVAVQCGWYKVYHPLAFYCAWLSAYDANAVDVDVETMLGGHAALWRALKQNDTHETLQILCEATARGIEFLPPDAARSHPVRYLPENGKIRLPLSLQE